MRPKGIVYFERLIFVSLAIGVIATFLAPGTIPPAELAYGVIIFALLIGLTLLISRRRSKIAMWIFVGLFLVGLLPSFKIVFGGAVDWTTLLAGIQVLMQGVAIVLLFTSRVKRWMGRKADPEAEANIFS